MKYSHSISIRADKTSGCRRKAILLSMMNAPGSGEGLNASGKPAEQTGNAESKSAEVNFRRFESSNFPTILRTSLQRTADKFGFPELTEFSRQPDLQGSDRTVKYEESSTSTKISSHRVYTRSTHDALTGRRNGSTSKSMTNVSEQSKAPSSGSSTTASTNKAPKHFSEVSHTVSGKEVSRTKLTGRTRAPGKVNAPTSTKQATRNKVNETTSAKLATRTQASAKLDEADSTQQANRNSGAGRVSGATPNRTNLAAKDKAPTKQTLRSETVNQMEPAAPTPAPPVSTNAKFTPIRVDVDLKEVKVVGVTPKNDVRPPDQEPIPQEKEKEEELRTFDQKRAFFARNPGSNSNAESEFKRRFQEKRAAVQAALDFKVRDLSEAPGPQNSPSSTQSSAGHNTHNTSPESSSLQPSRPLQPPSDTSFQAPSSNTFSTAAPSTTPAQALSSNVSSTAPPPPPPPPPFPSGTSPAVQASRSYHQAISSGTDYDQKISSQTSTTERGNKIQGSKANDLNAILRNELEAKLNRNKNSQQEGKSILREHELKQESAAKFELQKDWQTEGEDHQRAPTPNKTPPQKTPSPPIETPYRVPSVPTQETPFKDTRVPTQETPFKDTRVPTQETPFKETRVPPQEPKIERQNISKEHSFFDSADTTHPKSLIEHREVSSTTLTKSSSHVESSSFVESSTVASESTYRSGPGDIESVLNLGFGESQKGPFLQHNRGGFLAVNSDLLFLNPYLADALSATKNPEDKFNERIKQIHESLGPNSDLSKFPSFSIDDWSSEHTPQTTWSVKTLMPKHALRAKVPSSLTVVATIPERSHQSESTLNSTHARPTAAQAQGFLQSDPNHKAGSPLLAPAGLYIKIEDYLDLTEQGNGQITYTFKTPEARRELALKLFEQSGVNYTIWASKLLVAQNLVLHETSSVFDALCALMPTPDRDLDFVWTNLASTLGYWANGLCVSPKYSVCYFQLLSDIFQSEDPFVSTLVDEKIAHFMQNLTEKKIYLADGVAEVDHDQPVEQIRAAIRNICPTLPLLMGGNVNASELCDFLEPEWVEDESKSSQFLVKAREFFSEKAFKNKPLALRALASTVQAIVTESACIPQNH